MKLQKYMSLAWICSRRKAEEYIAAWQVYVNGQIAHIGQIIDSEKDVVKLGGKAVDSQNKFVYYKFNKPRWIETTCAQKEGKSIIDIISLPERVFPVGRLDKDTTGLILLTNDGRMTNYLTHPRYGHEKEYIVETFWAISERQLETMRSWVMILWKMTQPCDIERIAAWKFSIILTEGRNRQIRRMVESVGSKVKRLKRIRIENILLGDISEGIPITLSKKEKQDLFERIWLNETDY